MLNLRNIRIQRGDVVLRSVEMRDIRPLWQLIHEKEAPLWKQWDGPYYPLERKSLDEYREYMSSAITSPKGLNRLVMEVDGLVVGTVSCYWVDKVTEWLELGITIHRDEYWGRGIGTNAFGLWIDYVFANTELVRVGCSTWSGNERMIKCGQKWGMSVEGRIRKARIVDGQHYDSIKMGILREEWEQRVESR